MLLESGEVRAKKKGMMQGGASLHHPFAFQFPYLFSSSSFREALIKSLFAFILKFLCNARNGLTRIASYLRKPMTKQCIKILIKENSMN